MTLVRIATVDRKASPVRRRPGEVLNFQDGPSPRGSTYYKTLLACPREFALRYDVGLEPELLSAPLATGQLHHKCLELYFRALQEHQMAPGAAELSREEYLWGGAKEAMRRAYEVLDTLRAEPGYAETADELDRMLGSWFERYHRRDEWRIVAVEETIEYRGRIRYSARLDLVVEDLAKHGLYPVEFKTARFITEDLVDNYQMDWQILGQVWLLETCINLKRYLPFKGVVVDITTKHKTPQHARVDVLPSRHHLKAFEESVVQWSGVIDHMKFLGWPRALGHCSGYARGYSKCQMYDICHGHPEMTVDAWKKLKDPPLGFVRMERPT